MSDDHTDPIQQAIDEEKRKAEGLPAKITEEERQEQIRQAQLSVATMYAVRAINSAVDKANATFAKNGLPHHFVFTPIEPLESETYRAEYVLKTPDRRFALAGGYVAINGDSERVLLEHSKDDCMSTKLRFFEESNFSGMLAEVYKQATS